MLGLFGKGGGLCVVITFTITFPFGMLNGCIVIHTCLALLIVDNHKMHVEFEVLVHDPYIDLLHCFVGGGTFNLGANSSKKEGIMRT